MTGWVPDIANELDRGRVFVSPIRYGTGLKTKNIEAMATGIPIVATTISIEGSGAIDGVTACVADDPAKFADAIVSLLTDDARWNAQSGAARSFVAGRYALAPAAALMEETLRRIMKTPPRATGEAAAGGEPWSVDRVLSKDDEILHAKTAPERFRARLSAHIALADAHLAAGRPEEALGELRIVLSHCQDETFEKEPVFASSLMRRIAQAHCVHGQTALAEACDEEASELDRRGMNRAGDRSHPPSVAIEGKRAFAYLCPALDGKGWIAPLSAYLDRHTAADDVSLILLGPAVQLQDEVVSWLARSGRDENLVADIVIVAAPGDPDDFPRYLAAANALLVEPEASANRPGGAAGQAAGTTGANEFERLAREQSVPVLRAGVDLLAAPRR